MADIRNFSQLEALANIATHKFVWSELNGKGKLKIYTKAGLVAYTFIPGLKRFVEHNPPLSDEAWVISHGIFDFDAGYFLMTAHLFYAKTGF